MSQQMSRATQEKIDELIHRTQEKEEERKKRKELQTGEASSSSQEHPSHLTRGQETIVATSEAGLTMSIRHTSMGDESARTRKMDDESGQEEEIDVEGLEEEIDVEGLEEATVEQESGSTVDDDDSGDEPSVVEFKDPIYELSQM